jgi:Dolichyl-phosphate-mannose-protein mannosyltransferase
MSTIKPANPEASATQAPAPLRQRPGVILGVALLIAIGLLRIVSTYHVFNHTIDEGAHLACGIQWYQGVYNYDPKHTPIARISVALLPYLDGVRGYGNPSFWEEGVLVLSSGGRYWRNLTLARIGVLPYFVLGIVVIFLWTRRVYGYPTAWIAAGIFSMLPVVLAHSALATTDIPLTAFFVTAVYAFTRWLSAPNWRTAAGFGIATGLAISTKLSSVAFLPVTMAGVLPLYLASRRRASAAASQGDDRWELRNTMRSTAIVTMCAFLVIWAAYRFSHAPINKFSSAPDKIASKVFGSSSTAARAVHVLTAKLQLPAPELYDGLRDLRDIDRIRPRSYMFGQVKQGGWWYFYPVAIAVKTPLAVLLLAVMGVVWLGVSWFHTRTDWQRAVPLVAALAPIVVAAPSHLDIGVRHVMPVFAFLSMLAAVGAVGLWNYGRAPDWRTESTIALWAGRVAVVILFAWFVISSARAHPDYLSYFNELGGRHPENILVISDLDWGQDLARLETYLREHQVKHVSIAYDGFFDPTALGFPEMDYISCGATPSAWVAVEVRRARLYPECYPWLGQQQLIATVGKTMLIYHVPEAHIPGAASAITGTPAQIAAARTAPSTKTPD